MASGDPLVCSHQGKLIVDEGGELAGIITRGDIVRAFARSGDASLTVLEAGQKDLIVTYPDETLYDVIAKLLRHDIGRLPVVERSSPKKVIGYLGRAGILRAREKYHREEDVRERGSTIRSAARRLRANGAGQQNPQSVR
ncbi:MAG: CBS domain-containing protein [Verrucomicrobia bacterium]|nr:CBS domain-containing protein [Verrucomicrobiota bacterium]